MRCAVCHAACSRTRHANRSACPLRASRSTSSRHALRPHRTQPRRRGFVRTRAPATSPAKRPSRCCGIAACHAPCYPPHAETKVALCVRSPDLSSRVGVTRCGNPSASPFPASSHNAVFCFSATPARAKDGRPCWAVRPAGARPVGRAGHGSRSSHVPDPPRTSASAEFDQIAPAPIAPPHSRGHAGCLPPPKICGLAFIRLRRGRSLFPFAAGKEVGRRKKKVLSAEREHQRLKKFQCLEMRR